MPLAQNGARVKITNYVTFAGNSLLKEKK